MFTFGKTLCQLLWEASRKNGDPQKSTIRWSGSPSAVVSTTDPLSLTRSITSDTEAVVNIIVKITVMVFHPQQWAQEVATEVVHQVHPSPKWFHPQHHFLHSVGQTVRLPRPFPNRQCITSGTTLLIQAVYHNDRDLHQPRKAYLDRRLAGRADILGRFIEVEGILNGRIIQLEVGEAAAVPVAEGHEVVAVEGITLEVVEVCRMIRLGKDVSVVPSPIC